jgi:hypothetical protein
MLTWMVSSRHWRWYVLTVLLLVFGLVHMSSVIRRHGGLSYGDNDLHRLFGERFLHKSAALYDGNLCFNYMPVSSMYYAPLALVPQTTAYVLRYLVALGCLGITLWLLCLMLPRDRKGLGPFALVCLTLLLAIRFFIPDLEDGGPHPIYLAMIVGGWYLAWRGREIAGGTVLGFAIAVKMSPALLLPYLAWKRRWRLLGITAAATAAWIMVPALWYGPALWWQHQRQWTEVALGTFTGNVPESVRACMEENDLRTRNQSLRLALLHPLMTYPEGHNLHPDYGYWCLLDLPPSVARLLMNLGLVALLAAFWWPTRERWAGPGDPVAPLELCGLLLLMLLLSPVTWTHHLVWAVPAIFFLLAANWPRRWAPLAWAGLGIFFVIELVQSRDVLGYELAELLLASHIYTAAMLLLLGLVMWRLMLPRQGASTAVADPEMRRAA